MNITQLGQVFTQSREVDLMLSLRKNSGLTLEPSAGNGSFFNRLTCTGIEIDSTCCPIGCLNIDFFDYPIENKFDTIIGNPPYVYYNNILNSTKSKLKGYDKRTNLYIFFIDKCLDHLNDGGELIFITPRDFLKGTSAARLNEKIFNLGTITDLIDLGDKSVFDGYSPNCIIWRFCKGNYSRITNGKTFTICDGQLLFLSSEYSVPFSDLFFVRVGAVSGLDEAFVHKDGNVDFVYSQTHSTGCTRKVFYDVCNEHLEAYKDRLMARRVRKFGEKDWWKWGRGYYLSDEPRVYVNCKTRKNNPFFVHPCINYDGSVLAIFSKTGMDVNKAANLLNGVDWKELGFVCDGRYIFSQRSLEKIILPKSTNV